MTDFLKVARVEDIAEGGTLPLETDGELVCLAKVEGCIYAFTDNCTHISGPLNEGELEGHVLGKVLRGPARQDILTYPVKVEDNTIFIQLPNEE